MSILITVAVVIVGLLCLGPIGAAIIAGVVALVWGAVQLTLWLAGILLGAVIFPIWWAINPKAAKAAWKAGRG